MVRMIDLPVPTLRSCGQSLDGSPEAFGELVSSAEFLEDPDALRARLADLGYLYLPGFFEREAILAARRTILRWLAERGGLDPAHALEEAVPAEQGYRIPVGGGGLAKEPALHRVLREGRLIRLFERLLGGAIRPFDFTWFRNTIRGQSAHPHCDIVYMGRGTPDLFTAWIPYGDVPLELGGLMVLEDSHRKSERIRNYLERDVDAYCSNHPEARAAFERGDNRYFVSKGRGWLSKNPASLRQHLGGRWLSTDYAAGDVMIFGMRLVHGSLDNQEGRFRLSTDTRYQLASEPVDGRWIGENPAGHSLAGKRGRIC